MFFRNLVGLIISILFVAGQSVYAQETVQWPDSILSQLEETEGFSEQAPIVRKWIIQVGKSDATVANKYARVYFNEAKEEGSQEEVLEALFVLASSFSEMGQYAQAEKHFIPALNLAKEIGTNRDIARIYNELGVIYDFQGRWKSAIEVYYKALRTFEKMNDSLGMAHAYNNIGLIHFDQKQITSADSMFKLTLEWGKIMHEPSLLAMAYSNMAMVQVERKQFAKALKYYNEVLQLDLQETPPSQAYLGSDYNSIATCYMELRQYNNAQQAFEKALKHKTKAGNQRAIASTRHKMGILKIRQGQIAASLRHLNIAERLAKNSGDPDLLMEIYDSKAEANKIAGRLNATIEYLEKKEVLKDSLYKAEVVAATMRIEEEFDSEKKEATIDDLAVKLDKKSSQVGILVFGAIVLLLLGIFLLTLYRLLRQKNGLLNKKQVELDDALDKLNDQNKHVERQNIRLESALKIKTRFLSVISHEIRTPLHVIQGIAEIIRTSDLDDEQNKQVSVLMNSSRQLAQLVNEILNLNKLEAGKFTLHEEMFDFKTMAHEMFEAQRYHASSNKLQSVLELDDNLPQYLYTDKVKLQQIINNLMSNAIKFTNAGKVTLRMKLKEETHNEATIFFEVEDTGIGISPEEKENIFEPFHQSDYGMSRNRDGSGLGLAITKGLIELFGGELELETYVGQGSKFYFTISLRKGHKKVTKEKPAMESSLDWPAERKVLVAEDHEQNVLILKMILQRVGIQATWTKNGLEALNASKEEDYDIVLMDLHMPVMDGMESSKKIRQYAKTKGRQPIIIGLTASNEEEVTALPMGLFDQVLYKPYRPQELYQVLEESLLAFA